MSARLYGVSIAAMLALVASQFANGQVTTQTQAVSAGDLTEIIVTARRTEENLEDVPISITVFNQQQLENRDIVNASDLARYVPSLSTNVNFGSDNSTFALRGFVQDNGTAPSVGVFLRTSLRRARPRTASRAAMARVPAASSTWKMYRC